MNFKIKIQYMVKVIFCSSILFSSILHSEDGKGTSSNDKNNSPGLYFDKQSQHYFINDKASFSIRPIEDQEFVERIEVSIDQGVFEPYKEKIQFKQEGFHLVRFKAVDHVLNWSPIQSFRIYVDLTGPQTSVNWSGKSFQKEGNLYVGPKDKMILSAQDNLAGVSKIEWAGGENDSSIRHYQDEVSFSQEGEHKIRFSSVDYVGNREVWKDYRFLVDATPPISKAQIQGNSFKKDDKLFLNKGGLIKIESQDTGSGAGRIEYRFGKGPVHTYHREIVVESKVTELQYRAIDLVDNEEDWKTLTVYLDSMPPEIKIKKQGKHVSMGGQIYALPGFQIFTEVDDRDSGVHQLLLGEKNEEIHDPGKVGTEESRDKNHGNLNKVYTFQEQGPHVFFLRARDQVGNISDAISYNIIIDNTGPKSEFSTSQPLIKKGDVFLSAIPNKLGFKAEDQGSGVDFIEISYDGKNFNRVSDSIDLSTWDVPKRTLYYRAVDKLGNLEEIRSLPLFVRLQGPKVDLFVESENLPDLTLSKLRGQNLGPKIKEDKEDEERENDKEDEMKDERTPASLVEREVKKDKDRERKGKKDEERAGSRSESNRDKEKRSQRDRDDRDDEDSDRKSKKDKEDKKRKKKKKENRDND